MSMTAFEIFGVLKLDSQQFNNGLNAAKSALGGGIATAAKVGAAAVAAATTAVIGFGKAAQSEASKFESAFAGVKKTVDASAQDYDSLSQWIMDASTKMASSKEEIAGTMEIAGQLGVRGVEGLEKFTETMIMLGDSTNLNAEEAASALAHFSNIAGVPAEEVDRIGSSIVDLGNHFATTEADIVNMSTRLASAGTIAGFSATDILGLATAMSSVGINAEAGGTAMSTVMEKIGRAVANETEALGLYAKTAGMSAGEFSAAWKDRPITALQAFIKGLENVRQSGGNVVQILDTLKIKNVREANAVKSLALAADVMTDAVMTSNRAFEENNALQNEASQRYKTSESMAIQATEAFKNLQVAIGQELMPTYSEFMSFSKDAFGEIEKGLKSGGLTGMMEAVGDALSTALNMIVKKLPTFVRGGVSLLGALAKGISDNMDSIIDAAQEIGKILVEELTRATKDIPRQLAGFDWKGASEQMLENLKEAIGALSGEGGLINIAFDIILALMRGLTEAAPALVESAAFILDTLLTGISNAAPDYFLVASDQIGKFAESIGAAATELIPHAVETLIDVFIAAMENIDTLIEAGEALITGLWNGILASLPILKERAPEILDSLTTAIMEHPEAFAVLAFWLMGGFKKAVDLALSPFRTLGSVINSALSNAVSRGFTALRTVIGNALSPIRTQIVTIVRSWGSALSSGLSTLGTALSSALSSAAAFATADMGAVLAAGGVAAVGMMVAAIVGSIAAAFGGAEIGKKIGAAIFPDDAELYEHYSGISGTLEMLKDTVIGAWDLIAIGAEGLRDKIIAKWEEIKGSTTATWGDVSVVTQTVWDAVKNKITAVVEEARAKAVEKWNEIKTGTEEAWNKVKETTERIWGNILKFLKEDIFTKLAKAAFDWGRDMIGNFVDGIKKKWGELKKGLGGLAEKVADYIGFSEPKEGPLSNFHTYAPDMIDLFSEGIRSNSGRLLDSVRDAFDFEDAVAAPAMPDLNNFVPITAGRSAGGESSRDLTVILELDRTQLAKAVYKLNNDETQRIGTRLARGFA